MEDNAHVNSISTKNTSILNVLLIFYCSTENNNHLVLFPLYSHLLFSYLHLISIHCYCSLLMERLLFFLIVPHIGYLLFSTVYSPHCKWVSPHRTLPTYSGSYLHRSSSYEPRAPLITPSVIRHRGNRSTAPRSPIAYGLFSCDIST